MQTFWFLREISHLFLYKNKIKILENKIQQKLRINMKMKEWEKISVFWLCFNCLELCVKMCYYNIQILKMIMMV